MQSGKSILLYVILVAVISILQIEIKDYQQNAGKSQKVLTDIEKQKQTLKRKLDRANQERDSLANDVLKVQTESRALKSKLTTVSAEHEAAIEKAENLSNAMEEKCSEVADLKKIKIEEKLQLLEIQVSFIQSLSFIKLYMYVSGKSV